MDIVTAIGIVFRAPELMSYNSNYSFRICVTHPTSLAYRGFGAPYVVRDLGCIGLNSGQPHVHAQAITQSNGNIVSNQLFETNFSEIQRKLRIFSSMKCDYKCHLQTVGHFLLGKLIR